MNTPAPDTSGLPDQARRNFLGRLGALAAAGAASAGLVVHEFADARPLDQAVSSKNRWGLLIDAEKCATGCTACVEACHTENGVHQLGRPLTDAQWIRKVHLRDTQTQKEYRLPMLCQHCEHPPCVDVCPTGASFKRADGIVLVDRHICIGCRYCMMACPYKARSFVHEPAENQSVNAPRGKGCVESCTLCVHRVDRGGTPACVEACNGAGHEAMIFGDLNDPGSRLSQALKQVHSRQLRADLKLNPGVRYSNF
jgi:molybdopterin-containing oxidoreductase family iron-sulfur binding subunit